MTAKKVHKTLTEGIQKYFQTCKFQKAVLGLSGGLDSSVTLKLAVDALGAQNVFALILPEKGLSKPENINHAKGLADFLGIKYFLHNINSFFVDYAALPWKQNDIAAANTKARVRANLLYNFSNSNMALVLGTSNKSELMLGYGTKYGDLASDIMPLGDLYKTEVIELADFMELPKEIIEKTPSAELYEGQTDEDELGGTYKEIDPILQKYEMGEAALIQKGMNAILVRNVLRRIKANKHKLEMPYIIPLKT